MSPLVDASPWPVDVPFSQGAILVDLVYNPPVTRLMREAGASVTPVLTRAGEEFVTPLSVAALARELEGATGPRHV